MKISKKQASFNQKKQKKPSQFNLNPQNVVNNLNIVTDLPGYIDPQANITSPPNMRFAEQDEDYFNPKGKSSDANIPGKEIEIIRQEGLSNGIVLVNKKRTANVETGEFTEMFSDLRKD